jgi:hypothetical protein
MGRVISKHEALAWQATEIAEVSPAYLVKVQVSVVLVKEISYETG